MRQSHPVSFDRSKLATLLSTPLRSEGQGRSFERSSFGDVADMMEEFRKARTLTEEHYQSLQTVIQHIGFGLHLLPGTTARSAS